MMMRPTFGEWIADKQRELHLDRNGDPIPAFEGSSLAPVELIVKRFKCPWCPKSWSKRARTAGHIVRCWRNPANRTCKSCANYERSPDYGPCFPGENCSCGAPDHQCNAGVGLPEFGVLEGFPIVACPLWEAVTTRA